MTNSAEAWPNGAAWKALCDGAVVDWDDGTRVHLSVVDCGRLKMPSGRLVVCDPFAAMRRTGNAYVDVPPGEYPVRVTLADVSGKGDGSHIREAYATILLSESAEVVRRALTPSPTGTLHQGLPPGEYIGFPVDAGTACFVDQLSLERCMPDERNWHEGLFENESDSSWFSQMDNATNVREGIANIQLPLSSSGENLVLFHSGWGDGLYPVVGGFDSEGRLARVHVDFMVL